MYRVSSSGKPTGHGMHSIQTRHHRTCKASNMKAISHLLSKTKLLVLISVAVNMCCMLSMPYLISLHVHSHHGETELMRLVRCVCDDMRNYTVVKTIPELEPVQEVSTSSVSNQYETEAPTELEKTVQEHHLLVVAVLSSPVNLDRRNAIRKTWKKGYKERDHYVKFVLGTKNLSTDLIQSLEKENSLHQDLILLASIIDAYSNLTQKVLDTLIWFDQNVNYSYLLKCDDDTFAILDILEDELFVRDHTRGLYWGYFANNSPPQLDGKWAEPNWKFCDRYFPYAYGGGYILSADVVHRIVLNADAIIAYNSEDVSVGAWTVIFDIERKHDVRFDTESLSRGCSNKFVVTHKQAIKDISYKHKYYRKTGRLCGQENLLIEFEYDWNVLPSKAYKWKCCGPTEKPKKEIKWFVQKF